MSPHDLLLVILLVAFLILEILAAFGLPASRVNLMAAGLACLAGALLVEHFK